MQLCYCLISLVFTLFPQPHLFFLVLLVKVLVRHLRLMITVSPIQMRWKICQKVQKYCNLAVHYITRELVDLLENDTTTVKLY